MYSKKATRLCACGYLGDSSGKCQCTPDQVGRYRARISGPLLDRIDLQLFVPRVERAAMNVAVESTAESSAVVRERVSRCREIQIKRSSKPNARLTPKEIEKHCVPDAAARQLLESAMTRLALSARAYHRVLKVARTIADLTACENINSSHIAEAVRYRELDRGAL